ncbi:hypothetical protein EJ04DRAFT_561554 [Polyplosphaeria fusca]|uniref:Rhodopsin domain-containing protein n=1 Tax=Polyplosphaeria fusca TaxID=682080 RepID=A0A9P4R1E4_9PLEO|nr:hypothetical protein EJ04DRAFT_561554 [Polyplosphaeria fusca]
MPGGIHPPLEVIASWPPGNYLNPTTRSNALLVVSCVFAPLSLALLLARLYVRLRMQHNAGWDDWVMLAAMPFVVAVTVLWTYATEVYGFNKHVWDVDPKWFIPQRKAVMAIECVFCIASGLIKISILLFYRRLSSRSISSGFRWATWITIGFIAAYSIAFTLVPLFACQPMSAFWDQLNIVKVAQGYKFKCINEGADVFSAGVISTVQDLVTAMLPTFLYWNLQIPTRQKVALFGIFAIAYGVVGLGALRTYFSWVIFFESYDVTWIFWDISLTSMLELHIGIMCANAPALKVFFAHFFRLDRLTTRSKSHSGNSASKRPNENSSSGGSSILSKFAIWKHTRDQTSKGYLSEPHTDMTVDIHGGVEHSKQIRKTQSITTDTVNMIGGRETYSEDIEMGNWDTKTGDSDLVPQPLTALPSHPGEPHALTTPARSLSYTAAGDKKRDWESWA